MYISTAFINIIFFFRNSVKMNKALLLILIPCVVAFAMVQAQYYSYGGPNSAYYPAMNRPGAFGRGFGAGSSGYNSNGLLTAGK